MAPELAGQFEGTATSPLNGPQTLRLEIEPSVARSQGLVVTREGSFVISSSGPQRGHISLFFSDGRGNEGVLAGTYSPDEITGRWALGSDGGSFRLKRIVAVSSSRAAETSPEGGVTLVFGNVNRKIKSPCKSAAQRCAGIVPEVRDADPRTCPTL